MDLEFDEGSGTIAHDSSGYGSDGTLSGPSWVDGKFGNALSFDGINDYVTISDADSLDFGTGDFTVDFWMKPINTPASIAGAIYKGFLPGWGIWWRNTQQVFARWGYSVSDYVDTWSDISKPLSFNEWHNVVFVANRSSNKAYFIVDGTKHTETICPTGTVSNSNPMYLGWETDYFNGIIDEVRIYNKALIPDETINFRLI